MNTKLHATCDSQGRPLNLFVTAGQVSDYIGARALLSSLPDVDWLLGDRGYDADWFREALKDKGIRPCIPGRKQRKKPIKYDKRRYKRRNRIEIMFGRLKDWRRVATRYDRCPKVFLSAIALAALVIYWLCVLTLRAGIRRNDLTSERVRALGVLWQGEKNRATQLRAEAHPAHSDSTPAAGNAGSTSCQLRSRRSSSKRGKVRRAPWHRPLRRQSGSR